MIDIEKISGHYNRIAGMLEQIDAGFDNMFTDEDDKVMINQMMVLADDSANVDHWDAKPKVVDVDEEAARRVAQALIVIMYGADAIIDRSGHAL